MSIPHISVCVCTYKRPHLLNRLLFALEKQQTQEAFTYSVVIVDNDASGSAYKTVKFYADKSRLNVEYHVEPERSIALARNRAVEKANGGLIAFIDDDEIPVRNWLLRLFNAINQYKADGVLGPVLPYFEIEPPVWIIRGRFFNRPSHQTGHLLSWKYTRTGNALVKRSLFPSKRMWFDPKFGSGGEDRDFFRRKIQEGHTFIWCNEAPVFESISPERWKRGILLKRALLRGKVAFNASDQKSASILKSFIAVSVYSFSLPLLFILSHHVFMKYLIKNCDHIGKIFAFLGLDPVKEKYVSV